MLTAVLTLCDHVSGCPSGDVDQSLARIRAPISPPPASHAGLVGSTLIIDNPAVKTRGTISRRIGLTAPFVQGNKSAMGPDCVITQPGSDSDLDGPKREVRFAPINGHRQLGLARQICASNGLMHRSK